VLELVTLGITTAGVWATFAATFTPWAMKSGDELQYPSTAALAVFSMRSMRAS